MHRFSASAIIRVDIANGETKPVRITVTMENVTGLFQIEEVLMAKVKASPILPYIELCALIGDDPRASTCARGALRSRPPGALAPS